MTQTIQPDTATQTAGRLTDFMDLSRVLTAEEQLDREIATQYLERIGQEPAGRQLEELLRVFREITSGGENVVEGVRARIMGDDSLAPLAQMIVILWFTSVILDDKGDWKFDRPEQYFSGLMWGAVHAHVPGLSGGYHGHWRYPPEN
jgi:hypothetical protein